LLQEYYIPKVVRAERVAIASSGNLQN